MARNLHQPRHSLESCVAESAISFGDFPSPPSTSPNTPTERVFPTQGHRGTTAPLIPQRRPLPKPSNLSTRSGATSHHSRTLSPHDWHEGASSIDVDATEDRLLSTSFITSLLRETTDTRHHSFASEATSEMSYPPVSRLEPRSTRQGPPPSSFVPVNDTGHPEVSGDDSDTLYSNQDQYMPTVIRSASRARLQGSNVVGVAPARLHSVPTSREPSQYNPPSPGPARVLSDDGKLAAGEYDIPVSSMPFSPALPSTAGSQLHFLSDSPSHSNQDTRQSIHSARSFVPSFISRVSSSQKSLSRLFARRKVKPLPPVPVIPHIPIADERTYRREDESVPLPVLVERASTLNGLLEKGYHPHHSLSSYYHSINLPKDEAVTSAIEDFESRDEDPWRRRPYAPPLSPNMTYTDPESPRAKEVTNHPRLVFTSQQTSASGKKKKKTVVIVVCVFIVIALAAIGAGVGISLSRKSSPTINCSGEFTGAACNMNSTCVCTSGVSGRCDGLAQNIVDLLPTMNGIYNSNYTLNAAYISLWFAQGSVTESTCASQSLLIDVAPGLVSGNHPNRTAWAQSSLLWNLLQSQDLEAVQTLQTFVVSAPWSKLANSDGPVEDPLSTYSVSASGFTFNFATQTISQPSVSFVNNGQPSDVQNSRVGSIAHNALDRMYSYALASSTQRQGALLTYWTSVLLQKPSDLSTFLSRVVSSPILIPFDGTSQQIAKLYDASSPFPPPISCYPQPPILASQFGLVSKIETVAFDLPSLAPASKFDVSCYPNRPTYGVLDLLRLRLPFLDSRKGVAKQAVVLNREVGPRLILHSGEILSALPANDSSPSMDTNPRQFGTLNHVNHVVLSYLQAMDVNVATAVANYVLANGAMQVPPTNATIPFQYLSSIPSIEVAVFGFILPDDISATVSSFTTPSGALFFGSDIGEQFRVWSLAQLRRAVQWAESSVSPLIGDDSSLSDTIFNQTWEATVHALQAKSPVSVSNITNALQSNGKLTPT